MRVTFNKVAYSILVSYLIVSCYTGYIIVRNKVWKEKIQQEKFRQMSELAEDDTDWNPWGEEFENEQLVISHHEPPKILWNLEPKNTVSNKGSNSTNRIFNVEVWGKAAIGLYLWEHILERTSGGKEWGKTCKDDIYFRWLPLETDETREQFIQALSQSDLTLNPVGVNTECYRIYEAITYGSIPVVEDIMTPGNCGKSKNSNTFPLRLLKEMDAPIIYIKDWSELTKILENEKKLRHSEVVKRRRNILLWYESFKSKMRQKLIGAMNRHFFGLNR
ncbi:ribitol-5-phosphate xylosyltransferase 1-like [Mercenaria mercenaria]|uniref:ribitol-5-phosphate xylosyltransferase 1-like n=1 Tax=Mercenaria mercenaria TaxID=6596 RepID=UPI00234FB5C5|nr:ribitol-5-phosphate xylosyltransferase 1-like [Mercenaria mercenaria]